MEPLHLYRTETFPSFKKLSEKQSATANFWGVELTESYLLSNCYAFFLVFLRREKKAKQMEQASSIYSLQSQ